MRLPNGFGSVYKLSGSRRNPWAARKTIGWNDKGQPIYQFVGFYQTKQDALTALGAYNLNPTPHKKMPLDAVYELWRDEHFPNISPSLRRTYRSSWAVLKPLYGKDINDIRLEELQRTFNQSDKNAPVLKLAKIVLNQVYGYAEKYEIISPDKNRLKFLNINAPNPNQQKKTALSPAEIETAWTSDSPLRPYILILLYTGLRSSELLALTPDDIDTRLGSISIRKSKTPSGIRTVPICSRIAPILARFEPYPHNYSTFRAEFKKVFPNHSIHETRHTFISRLVELGADDRIIKAIVGHKDNSVTSIYTHISLEAMKSAVELLP